MTLHRPTAVVVGLGHVAICAAAWLATSLPVLPSMSAGAALQVRLVEVGAAPTSASIERSQPAAREPGSRIARAVLSTPTAAPLRPGPPPTLTDATPSAAAAAADELPAPQARVESAAAMSPDDVVAAAPMQAARPEHSRNPPPRHPQVLLERGIGGVVWLRVWVGPDGRAGDVLLLRGSGQRLLDEAALAAVRGWRFEPARRGSEALASWVEFPIRFVVQEPQRQALL